MNKPRGEHHGAFHHVFNKVIAGVLLGLCDEDFQVALAMLGEAAEKYGGKIHGFAFMDNHIHILVETPEPNLGKIMQHFKSRFTKWYNRKYNRRGSLFCEPYNNELIESTAQLKQVLRYIHNNPVKAGMVDQPEDHPWSSMAAYLGKAVRPPWLVVDFFLEMFQGRKGLRRFTSNLWPESPWDPHSPRLSRYSSEFMARHLQRPAPI